MQYRCPVRCPQHFLPSHSHFPWHLRKTNVLLHLLHFRSSTKSAALHSKNNCGPHCIFSSSRICTLTASLTLFFIPLDFLASGPLFLSPWPKLLKLLGHIQESSANKKTFKFMIAVGQTAIPHEVEDRKNTKNLSALFFASLCLIHA